MAVMGSAIMTVLVLSGLLHSAAAVIYEVGASVGGWVELANGQPNFDDQFANTILVTGDQLLFPYVFGAHNVYEVTPADLASCTGTNPIQTYTATNTTITLNTSGVHAYICEIPGHCNPGRMYLTVNVTELATAPAFAPVPAPVAGGPVPVPVPAPAVSAPAPGPSPVVPAPGAPALSPEAPGPSDTTPGSPGSPGSPGTAPSPEDESPGGSGANILLSGPAMLVGSLFVGCVALLL